MMSVRNLLVIGVSNGLVSSIGQDIGKKLGSNSIYDHESKQLYFITETRQLFSRVFVSLKKLKSCYILLRME